jgi:hypothetical protein
MDCNELRLMVATMDRLDPTVGWTLRKCAEPLRLCKRSSDSYFEWHSCLLSLEKAISDEADQIVLEDLRNDCLQAFDHLASVAKRLKIAPAKTPDVMSNHHKLN